MCAVDPDARWIITVTAGGISTNGPGGPWDDGSPPCPKVCLTIQGDQRCTPERVDTYAPVWNSSFPSAPARAFLSDGITFRVIDVDTVFDDDICTPAIVRLPPAAFVAGGGRINCTYASISYRLTAL